MSAAKLISWSFASKDKNLILLASQISNFLSQFKMNNKMVAFTQRLTRKYAQISWNETVFKRDSSDWLEDSAEGKTQTIEKSVEKADFVAARRSRDYETADSCYGNHRNGDSFPRLTARASAFLSLNPEQRYFFLICQNLQHADSVGLSLLPLE
jgi:hypothetical protein